jgi:DNA-binding XRE family transcriptional regulator
MRPEHLQSARNAARLTQQQAAAHLGVSQPYLALMERGQRPVPAQLLSRIAKLYCLGPTAMRLESDFVNSSNSLSLAAAVANLGYPPFHHLRRGRTKNPAVVLLAAIAAETEVRIVEALPWVIAEYSDLDWDWLVREAKLRDVQNRLGFLVTLARRVARKRSDKVVEDRLRRVEQVANRARLAREDTLCQERLSDAERRWLRQHRSADARHWNLLTDLDSASLPYAA